MPMKKPDSAASVNEMPTEHAWLEIVLVDDNRQSEPIVYVPKRPGIFVRFKRRVFGR